MESQGSPGDATRMLCLTQWPVSSALSACSRKSPKFKGYYCGCHSEAPISGCNWCCPVSFFPHHSQKKDDSNLGLKIKSIQVSYRKGSPWLVLEDHTPSVLRPELGALASLSCGSIQLSPMALEKKSLFQFLCVIHSRFVSQLS